MAEMTNIFLSFWFGKEMQRNLIQWPNFLGCYFQSSDPCNNSVSGFCSCATQLRSLWWVIFFSVFLFVLPLWMFFHLKQAWPWEMLLRTEKERTKQIWSHCSETLNALLSRFRHQMLHFHSQDPENMITPFTDIKCFTLRTQKIRSHSSHTSNASLSGPRKYDHTVHSHQQSSASLSAIFWHTSTARMYTHTHSQQYLPGRIKTEW